MARSPGQQRRVHRRVTIAGAPRERTTTLVPGRGGRSPFGHDGMVTTGHNPVGDTGHVWGRSVAPVTGRKSRKSPGWSSRIAGGSHIIAPGV